MILYGLGGTSERGISAPPSNARFPIGDEGLFIDLEDTASSPSPLRYVADRRYSEVRPGAIPDNLNLTGFLVGAGIGSRTPVPLSPKALDQAGGNHSHFVFAMLVKPDVFGIYLRLFRALFGALVIALIVLFIKPHHVDPRFGLPVGAFFAVVTNTVSLSSVLPYSDRVTLVDMVNVTGLVTIALILVQSAISLHIEDSGREGLSRFFDRVSFAVITAGYVAVNLALPLSARPA